MRPPASLGTAGHHWPKLGSQHTHPPAPLGLLMFAERWVVKISWKCKKNKTSHCTKQTYIWPAFCHPEGQTGEAPRGLLCTPRTGGSPVPTLGVVGTASSPRSGPCVPAQLHQGWGAECVLGMHPCLFCTHLNAGTTARSHHAVNPMCAPRVVSGLLPTCRDILAWVQTPRCWGELQRGCSPR